MTKDSFLTNQWIKILFLPLFYFQFSVIQVNAQFAKGADIGWLDRMEATGYQFYDSNGIKKDCIEILKEKGINTIRLRVWVNPSNNNLNGYCGKKEVVKMAIRAKARGMRIMIDFHYSDTWADPGHQAKPFAWANHSLAQLQQDVYRHTYEVLDTLKHENVLPEWVQIGNEIPGGMLWPEGSTNNWQQLAKLLNSGYEAVKAIDTTIKVIIHLDEGNNNNKYRNFFDNATKLGVHYDIIGMSFYPYWTNKSYKTIIGDLVTNMNDMISRFNKDVMIVEIGEEVRLEDETFNMLTDVIKAVKDIPGKRGLGVIYWEPEGANSWSRYQLNCWRDNGQPSKAMDAFLINDK